MINNHVLVIEDDKNIAEYFQAVLTLAGLEVEVLLSAREGFMRLSGSVPGLILLDMRLGQEIGGEDILYQIRSNPRFDDTHVIVVTGYPNTVHLVADLADLVLIKPVGIDQLTALAKRLLAFERPPKTHSFRDPVTNLFTYEFFQTRLELAYERGRRRAEFLYAVIIFQLEVYGPDGEPVDANLESSVPLLVEASRRLQQNLRPTDTIAREGGWKFITLNEDLRREDDMNVIIERIKKVFATPMSAGDGGCRVIVNYGAAARNPNFLDAQDVSKMANRALAVALKKTAVSGD